MHTLSINQYFQVSHLFMAKSGMHNWQLLCQGTPKETFQTHWSIYSPRKVYYGVCCTYRGDRCYPIMPTILLCPGDLLGPMFIKHYLATPQEGMPLMNIAAVCIIFCSWTHVFQCSHLCISGNNSMLGHIHTLQIWSVFGSQKEELVLITEKINAVSFLCIHSWCKLLIKFVACEYGLKWLSRIKNLASIIRMLHLSTCIVSYCPAPFILIALRCNTRHNPWRPVSHSF